MKDFKKLIDKLLPMLMATKRYLHFMYFIFLACLCGFLIYQLRGFTQTEPSQDAITQKLQAVQRPHIDPTVITKIQQLQDQNVQVQSLFQQARDNPFSE